MPELDLIATLGGMVAMFFGIWRISHVGMDKVDARIGALDTKIGALDAKIGTLEVKLESKIEDVRSASADAHKEIRAELSAMRETQARHDEKFNTVIERFNTVNERFNTVESNIKRVEDKVDNISAAKPRSP